MQFPFLSESRWKIALRCITPGWWDSDLLQITNHLVFCGNNQIRLKDFLAILHRFSLSPTWDVRDQTREMKYIVAKVLWPQSWKMSKQSWWRKEAQFPLHTGQTPPAVQNQSKSVRNILGLDKFKCAVDSLERFTFTFINWPVSRRWNVEMLLN